MEKYEIRLCERPTLTVEEAAALYNIGEHKIRDLTEKDSCPYVLYVGRKRLIKRKQFIEVPACTPKSCDGLYDALFYREEATNQSKKYHYKEIL